MFRGKTDAYICTQDLKEFIMIVFLAAAVRLVQMKEKVQYCFVPENKNACQEGEAWGIICINYKAEPQPANRLPRLPRFGPRLGGLLLEMIA